MLKKKIWYNFRKIIELSTQKIVTKLSKIWVWDPRSRIRENLFLIPDPGGKKIPYPDPQHCCHWLVVTVGGSLISVNHFLPSSSTRNLQHVATKFSLSCRSSTYTKPTGFWFPNLLNIFPRMERFGNSL
jgi:hypothetical protein